MNRALATTFEALESRRMFSVTASAANGLLTILGDDNPNVITVSRDPAGNLVVNGGTVPITGSPATIEDIQLIKISGFAGDDNLLLDETNGALPSASLSGGDGNDTLTGGSGDETLVGDAGNDRVFGRAGSDTLIWNSGDGADINEGGDGSDTFEVNGSNTSEAFLVDGVGNRILFELVDPGDFTLDIGTTENFILNANGGDDTFLGGTGLSHLASFTIDGGPGNDTLFGTDGNDTLIGGDGSDFVDGNNGADVVMLGSGDDFFQWSSGDDSDIVEGQDGHDTLIFNGSNDAERIVIGANGERVRVFRNIDDAVIDLNDVEQVNVLPLGGIDAIDVGNLSGTDLAEINVDLQGSAGGGDGIFDAVSVTGTDDADHVDVTGSASKYSVAGLHTIVNVDNSEGNLDNLLVDLEAGDDTFSAATLPAGVAVLTVNAGFGNDTIVGSQAGDDLLFGAEGNDFVDGKGGNDTLQGGDGDDTFQWNPGDGSDTVEGDAGSDSIIFNGSDIAEKFDISADGNGGRVTRDVDNVAMDLVGVETVDVNANGGADTITVHDLSATPVTAVNVDVGPTGDGAADAVVVNGTAGNDSIELRIAGLRVAGLHAVVALTNVNGADSLTINGGDGDDNLVASSVLADAVKLTENGEAGNDTLTGSRGNDTLFGGDGDDFLEAFRGNDVAFMGAGRDTFDWEQGDGSDTVDGQDGSDTMLFNAGNSAENFDLSANGNRVRFLRTLANAADVTMDLNGVEQVDLSARGGADTIVVNDQSATDLTALNIDLDSAEGTGFGDGATDAVIVNATEGNDGIQIASFGTRIAIGGLFPFLKLTGEDGLDTLTVNTLGGNDIVDAANLAATNASQLVKLTENGGPGNDTLIGSQGFDTFVWNPGDGSDTLEGDAGEDTMIFNGSDASEKFDISANGGRILFTRDVGGITMDLGDVEAITVNPLGGADTVTVNDLTGTSVTEIELNLAAALGGTAGDGQADSVIVNGTNGADLIPVAGNNGVVVVSDAGSLPYFVAIRAAEATDALQINGNGGNDTVNATSLAAGVIGLTVDGGAGNDTLIGSQGDDTFVWNPGDGSDVVEGKGGHDTMVFNGDVTAEMFELSANGGRLRFTRNLGNIVMDVDDVEQVNVNALNGTDIIAVNDLSGTDVTQVKINLENLPGSGTPDGLGDLVTVDGRPGADNLQIQGSDKSYSITGLPSLLTVVGSEVNASGFSDALIVNARAGDDVVNASMLAANAVSLIVDGTSGNDTITGSQGADTIFGGDGNDFIDGDRGNDLIMLDAGDDTFQWDPGEGSDTVEGDAGLDNMVFNGADTPETVDISANGNRVRFFRNPGNITMDLSGIEAIEFNALGGADNITIHNLAGTDATQVNVDLSDDDGQVDNVIIDGTADSDDIIISAAAGGIVTVTGVPTDVTIAGVEAADKLTILGQGGQDSISFAGAAADSASTIELNGSFVLNNDANGRSLQIAEGSVLFETSQHLASLTLSDNTRAALEPGGNKLLIISSGPLAIAPSAGIDLTDNAMIVQATPDTRDAVSDTVARFLATGRNGGLWNGKGLSSSTAGSNPLHNTGLMFVRNGSGGIILSNFANEVVTGNSILVKHTYNGDFNLSGSVDADDYSLIDTGFANGLTGMQNGDINLSGGPPDADDYALIDFAFATQGQPLAAIGASPFAKPKVRSPFRL